jgi:hypothetical protein
MVVGSGGHLIWRVQRGVKRTLTLKLQTERCVTSDDGSELGMEEIK